MKLKTLKMHLLLNNQYLMMQICWFILSIKKLMICQSSLITCRLKWLGRKMRKIMLMTNNQTMILKTF